MERRRNRADRRHRELHTVATAEGRLAGILNAVADHERGAHPGAVRGQKRTLVELLGKMAAAQGLEGDRYRSEQDLRRQRSRLGHRRRHHRAAPRAGPPRRHRRPARRRRHRRPLDAPRVERPRSPACARSPTSCTASCRRRASAGSPGTDPALVVSVNFFGAVALVEGLREPMAAAGGAGVVFLASNSITGQPGWAGEVAAACLARGRGAARSGGRGGARGGHGLPGQQGGAGLVGPARGRDGADWIGAGIRLNSVAPGKIATAMTEQLAADPVFGPLSEAYPTAHRPRRPGRGDRRSDRVPALGRRLAGGRLGAVRRRRHRRDPAPDRPGGLERDPPRPR